MAARTDFSATTLVMDNTAFLAKWTLPRVRAHWAIVGTEGKEQGK